MAAASSWSPAAVAGMGGWALPGASGSNTSYRLNTAASRGDSGGASTSGRSSSRGGGSYSSGGYSGRGSGPVVASGSALALSWSEEAPIWKDIPPPPKPKPQAAPAAAGGDRAASSGAASSSGRAGGAGREPRGAVVELRARPSAPALSVPLSAPPGQDPDLMSPAPIGYRCSGVAGFSGRPPPDAASRPLLLPSASALAYLDGSLPGDYGFDPLGLFDPSTGGGGFLSQRWLHTAELVHGRWAMLGAAGCLAPEYLAHEKVIPKATGLLWFQTGFIPQASAGFDYGLPLGALFGLQMLAMGLAEGLRWAEYDRPGSLASQRLLGLEKLIATTQPGSAAYPGGAMFNPLGLGMDRPADMREYQVAEIKHGRIAMLACLGYAAQAVVTGKGPYNNWVSHLEDPEKFNVLALLGEVGGR
ncbi:hypothetical protein GPECTOR_4g578 [Gonium pectorale]|uniref:Chlorophyll a-b binding protein, chloroplastic n=1 Tax=Gonium pectorale TaxID=33097 RepID=A0A150GXN2_GONPE|nr:hypothetical protein GPECTOR_4g578 [Gonium pectorale]|eukprot:KXZ54513.1 hypothetical protein GPECTOR_4g578 [Gonium pectorale]